MSKKDLSQLIRLASLVLTSTLAHAQSWTTIHNSPPAGVNLCMLLTDGGVMCQGTNAQRTSTPEWYEFKPDLHGSYLNGYWYSIANFPSGYTPYAYASAVLADGRVIVIGGEYNYDVSGTFVFTNLSAIYDPAANTWTMVNPPPSTGSPNHFACIGDAPATVLADGRFLYRKQVLLGSSCPRSSQPGMVPCLGHW
jgi:hypothetical protein